jgi:hypothetical protein
VRRIDADSLQKLSEDTRLGKPFPRAVKDRREDHTQQLYAEKASRLLEIREAGGIFG